MLVVGERFVGMAGIRDPYTIANVDAVIDWARRQTIERFGPGGWELHYDVFGRNGVMGDMEPLKDSPGTSFASWFRAWSSPKWGPRGQER